MQICLYITRNYTKTKTKKSNTILIFYDNLGKNIYCLYFLIEYLPNVRFCSAESSVCPFYVDQPKVKSVFHTTWDKASSTSLWSI